MNGKKLLYVVIVISAFVIGTQININFKTSQVFTSDVIAVVNNDQKVDYIDDSLKLGDNFVNQLEAVDSQYQFQTTSSAEASQGLVSGKYGAEILIPSNFTTSILSVNSERPTSTSITYSLNDKLLSSKSKSMEDEIVSNISSFEDNITYMYLYSIFDGLHQTQEGVEVAYENSQPVFTFLEELGEINIVSNHEYELADNNTDSFSIIDITEQLSQFGQTVDKYQRAIAEVIEVYKDENSGYSNLVDESIAVMSGNDQLLNERIENVEGTLDSVVEANQQYTEDAYSITSSRSNIQTIVNKYLDQLMTVNDTYDQNKKTVKNTHQINSDLKVLNQNIQVQAIKKLFNTRVSYYGSLDTIVGTCLSLDEAGASNCISDRIGDYNQGYTNYNNIISQFKDEQDYYQTMTYYLEHIGTARAESLDTASDEVQTFALPIEPAENPEVTESAAEQLPVFSLYSFGENLTASDLDDNNLVGLHIANANSTYSYTININKSQNISAISPLPTGLDNSKVSVEGDQIKISSVKAEDLYLLFDVQKTIDNVDANLELEYKDQTVELSIGDKNPLTATATADDSQVIIDYVYTVQADDRIVEYTDSKLVTDYGIDQFTLADDGDGAVTATSGGFEINTEAATAGDQIKFTISFDNLIGNQIVVESYTLAGQTFSFPIVSYQATVTPSLQIKDDPYIVDFDDISSDDDDIDGNSVVEPGERVGLKYKITIESPANYSVSKLKFTTNFGALIGADVSPEIIVQVDRTTLAPDVEVNGDEVTIDFGTEISSTDTPEPGSTFGYNLSFDIYINLEAPETINLSDLKTDVDVVFGDLELTSNGITSPTNTIASTAVKLAIGNVALDSVVYNVNADSCSGASELSECKFEAGEQITKVITIKNSGDAASGLVLNDEFDDDRIISLSNIEYALPEGATDFDSSQYLAEKINDDDPEHIKFSLPANGTLTITKTLDIDEDILKPTEILNSTELTQYGIVNATTETNLTITPLALKISILDDEQVTEDGVITPNEAVNITLEVKNNSTRGTSKTQYIQMTESTNNAIGSTSVISVEDKNWNPIAFSPVGDSGIVINQSLAPQEAFTIKLRITFNNLASAPGSIDISFVSYKGTYDSSSDVCGETNCDTISYSLSTNPDYLQLAKDQASNKAVIGGETYESSLNESEEVVNESSDLMSNVNEMREYINKYINLDIKLNKFTILDNQQIDQIKQQIANYGLGYESEDDDDYITDYDYCTDNAELSCQIFSLYDQIMSSEAQAKASFGTILQTIDPSDENQYGEKPSEDQETINPTNVGADFNGYGDCKSLVDEDGNKVTDETCVLANPGINERIDMQAENIDILEQNIDKILDNETEEVNKDPYKAQLTQINEQTNKVMDQVETENNELFGKKIDIYNQNYETVMDYVTAISEDPAYADAIEDFNGEELTRQAESKVILESVYNLLPNTYLDGIPNKLVYSFIASPFTITKQHNQQPIAAITETNHPWVIIFILGLLVLTAALIGILYYINREV